MSVQAIIWAMEQDISSAAQKLTLVALANYAGSDGVCWPGHEKLAKDTSQSKRNIVRCVEALEASGHLSRKRRFRDDGTRTSDLYQLHLPSDNVAPSDNDQVPNMSSPSANLAQQEPVREPLDVVVDARAREDDLPARAERAMEVTSRCCAIMGVSQEADWRWCDSSEAMAWLAGGADPEVDIYPTVQRLAASASTPIKSMRYFTQAIADAKATRERPLPEGRASPGKRKNPHTVLFDAAEELHKRYVREEENAEPTRQTPGNVRLIDGKTC